MIESTPHLPEYDETSARYVAQQLDAHELEAFELHLLECAECRDSVRTAATLRSALRLKARKRSAALFAPVGLAAAAGVAWLILTPGPLERLGRSDAPVIAAMEVRGNPDSAAAFAARGVGAYQSARYEEAARWLGRAYAEQQQHGTLFYLGASHLMANAPDSALAAFRAILDQAPNPYAAEAAFYGAKAWLRLGQADSAVHYLNLIGGSATPALRSHAKALADSIQRVR